MEPGLSVTTISYNGNLHRQTPHTHPSSEPEEPPTIAMLPEASISPPAYDSFCVDVDSLLTKPLPDSLVNTELTRLTHKLCLPTCEQTTHSPPPTPTPTCIETVTRTHTSTNVQAFSLLSDLFSDNSTGSPIPFDKNLPPSPPQDNNCLLAKTHFNISLFADTSTSCPSFPDNNPNCRPFPDTSLIYPPYIDSNSPTALQLPASNPNSTLATPPLTPTEADRPVFPHIPSDLQLTTGNTVSTSATVTKTTPGSTAPTVTTNTNAIQSAAFLKLPTPTDLRSAIYRLAMLDPDVAAAFREEVGIIESDELFQWALFRLERAKRAQGSFSQSLLNTQSQQGPMPKDCSEALLSWFENNQHEPYLSSKDKVEFHLRYGVSRTRIARFMAQLRSNYVRKTHAVAWKRNGNR